MALSVNTILSNGKDLQACSKRDLQILIAELLREILLGGTSAGSGGVLGGAGDPVSAPTTPFAAYIDTNTGRIWWYYNGQWN